MKKILAVDDSQMVLDALYQLLSKYGYRVLMAMDAMQATMQAVKEKPDLILLDIMMPAGGGFSVYERLKKNSETQSIPVLFLSAHPIEILRGKISAIEKGHFITKPWDNDELIATIKNILEQGSSKTESPLRD